MSRKLQVIKMRGQRQRPGLHAFRIGSAGIEIFPRIQPAPELIGAVPPLQEPLGLLSSGVPALDGMFGGGVPSGYSVLLVGPTGSGKTLLATEFLAAGAAHGEQGEITLRDRRPRKNHPRRRPGTVRRGAAGESSGKASVSKNSGCLQPITPAPALAFSLGRRLTPTTRLLASKHLRFAR